MTSGSLVPVHAVWWKRHAPALVAVLAIVIVIVMAGFTAQPGRASNSVPAPGWLITPLSPTTGLSDGQAVVINLKANPDVKVFDLLIRQCVAGQTYTTPEDVDPGTGKCPLGPVSSSADTSVHRSSSSGLIDASQSDGGATTVFRVGQGVAPLSGSAGGDITCDPTHDCELVVKLVLAGPQTVFWTTPITFGDSDPVAGCGGPASGVLAAGASDQMQEAYSAWTLAACKAPGAVGAPTRTSFPGEGQAVQGFESGSLDLAYTGAGVDPAVGLADPASATRTAVATPVALNAAVIAVGGGRLNQFIEKVPYTHLQLKPSDIAALFTGGFGWAIRDDKPYKASILGDNPELDGNLAAPVPITGPLAPSEAESSSWFMTNYLTKMAASDWTVPFTTTPRPASASMATAQPQFASGTLNLFSGRPVLSKVLSAAASSVTSGPIWVMTDLATATALHMTPVAIPDGDGTYVEPTPESLAAAVATMKPDANGILLPDPEAKSASTAQVKSAAVAPYPLTFVEYAYAPAEPLVDPTTCAARSTSQALLTNWLNYLVGDGQGNLPPGLVPLTPDLVTQAKAAIPAVGVAPVTGACAGKVTTAGAGGPGGTGGLGGSTSFPISGVRSPIGASVPGLTSSPTASTPGDTPSGTKAAIAIPAFAGRKLIGTSGAILALLGIVLVTSLAAWITAGGDLAGAGAGAGAGGVAGGAPVPLGARRISSIALLWVVVGIAGAALVVFQLGPLLAQRDQRSLLRDYRVAVSHAANESGTLQGVQTATKPPELGTPVGIIEIGALQTQDVAVEGAGASQTSEAPGHVPGTAGLGQPGNAVVVARRNGYGASFKGLDALRKSDRIVVTTTQGQSVYAVRSVAHVTITDAPPSSSTGVSSSASAKQTNTATATSHRISTDTLYGPTPDDRLTLVTSGSRSPLNSSEAIVVKAKLLTKPFAPTPQGARSSTETGLAGESGAWQGLALALLAFGAVIAASVFLYRRLRFRVAYVLTIAPLAAFTVIVGEALSRLLPAWM